MAKTMKRADAIVIGDTVVIEGKTLEVEERADVSNTVNLMLVDDKGNDYEIELGAGEKVHWACGLKERK